MEAAPQHAKVKVNDTHTHINMFKKNSLHDYPGPFSFPNSPLAFFEDGCNICPSPVIMELPLPSVTCQR